MHPSFDLHDDIAWGPNGGRASEVPVTEGGEPNPLHDDPPPTDGFDPPPPLVPNKADISKHLHALFAPAFVHPYPDSWIEIAYGDPAIDEGKPNKAENFSPFKLEEAVAFAEEKNRAGLNIYVGAALRHGERSYSGRASGHHVLAASHAWSEYEKAGDDERIAAILNDKDIVPALVLTTGTVPCPRRHLYFKLDASATADEIREANAALEKLLGSDNVSDPPRVMRLAGTVSYPPPKKIERGYITELVTLHHPPSARAHSLEELIGVAPGGGSGRSRGYNESEEKPASTVESFFKDVNALAVTRLSHWVKPLFGDLVKFYSSTGCWRTTPEANKHLPGRAHLEEVISISQRGVWDYGFEKPSDPISLVIDYGPRSLSLPTTAKDAAFWLCKRMDITPEALGWGTRERRSADDAGYEEGYGTGAGGDEGEKPPPKLLVSSAEFLASFVPPDYAIDALVQRRFCYSMTAPTGGGKTAVALLLSVLKALGLPLGKREIAPGRVLYFAGENQEDIKMRWIALSERMGFDASTIDVHFLPKAAKISEIAAHIEREAKDLGGETSLVVVDTSIAYYDGDDENHNIQAAAHARRLRSLTGLPGGPCVLVLCHPVKNPTPDNLLPRGGGAFLAEVDGNLTCWNVDGAVSMHWQGKFRGPDFAPITFRLESVTSERIKDSKGRLIPTVIAKALSEEEQRAAEANSRSDEDALLLAIADNERASFAGLAVALGWISSKGENKAKVKRCADRLKADKLVKPDRRGTLALTDKGKDEVKRLRPNGDGKC
jgi:hypothetical protein